MAGRTDWVFRSVWAAVLLGGAFPVAAQPPQVATSVPSPRMSEGFFERTGVAWGARGRGWHVSFGSGPAGFSPIGPQGAGGGAALSWAGRGGYFNLFAEQGSYRGLSSTAPSLTVTDGLPGSFRYGVMRPFVVGYVPVVATYGAAPGPPAGDIWAYTPAAAVLARYRQLEAESAEGESHTRTARATRLRQAIGAGGKPTAAAAPGAMADAALEPAIRHDAPRASSAARAVPSVARARALHAEEKAARRHEAEDYFRRGAEAEAAGKRSAACAYYRLAAARADGDLGREATDRLLKLGQPAARVAAPQAPTDRKAAA